jgi:hypothetical protein
MAIKMATVEVKGKEEFDRLVTLIDLDRTEDYDCSSLNVWSYRKAFDVREGLSLRLGNMANGFPFTVEGVPFINSECAYIAGAYASADDDSSRIQKMISAETNGQKAKRIYRHRPEFTSIMRDDFHSYNVQWMLHVIWQKCLFNKDFARLLIRLPIDSVLAENTSLHHGETATFWGVKNKELMAARKAEETKVTQNNTFRYKKDLEFAQMLAANKVNGIGHFTGINTMGKILKLCSLSLIYGQKPPIDLDLLVSKELYLLGKKIKLRK